MSFTFATVLFLPLAVWAAFRTSRTVAVLAGTVGFSATAVVNIPAIQFAVQPYHLFGTLLIVRALLDARVRKVERQRRRVTWVLYALFLYWVVALISVLAHKEGESTLFYMVSQLGHLGFGMAVCWGVSRVVRTPETLRIACRGFERGAVFLACWGIMQFAMYPLGIEYPKEIFNNSIGDYAGGSGATLPGLNIIRAGSAATEPSALGRTLVIALALMLVRHARGPMSERRRMVASAFVVVVGLLFSTSTTGIFGLLVLCGLGSMAGRRLRVQRFAAAIALVGALLPAISPSLKQALINMTLGKYETYSYNERNVSVDQARSLFRSHPWFGVGWGNFTSHDLAIKVLSNTGMLGAACLIAVLLGLLIGQVRREHAGALRPELRALKLAILMSVTMDWVAGWNYPYGDFWMIAGLLLAAFTFARPDSTSVDLRAVPASGETAPVLPVPA